MFADTEVLAAALPEKKQHDPARALAIAELKITATDRIMSDFGRCAIGRTVAYDIASEIIDDVIAALKPVLR